MPVHLWSGRTINISSTGIHGLAVVPLCLVDKFESHCGDHSVWQAAIRRMYAAKADQVLPNIRAARTVCSSFFRKRSPFILIRFLNWIHWTETNKKEQMMLVHLTLDFYSKLHNDALLTLPCRTFTQGWIMTNSSLSHNTCSWYFRVSWLIFFLWFFSF